MPPITEPPRALEFIFSEANGYRSREKVVIGQPAAGALSVPLLPGTLLYPEMDAQSPPEPTGVHLPVTQLGFTPGDGLTPGTLGDQATRVNAILMYPVDPRAGQVEAAAFVRDGEVNDAYLLYAIATTVGTPFTDDEILAATAALRNNGVIVRLGVLEEALANPPIEPPAITTPIP
jgi:hypothetical protein